MTLLQLAEQVKDAPTRNALVALAKEFERIQSVRPVSTNTTQLASAINIITGKLK